MTKLVPNTRSVFFFPTYYGMGTHDGYPWVPMGTHDEPMDTHGEPMIMGTHGYPWHHAMAWGPMGIRHGVMGTHAMGTQ